MDTLKHWIRERIEEVTPYVVEIRRELHRYPELRFKEEKTSKIVKEELSKMGYDCLSTVGTGLVTMIGEKKKKTVALRADMDALPVHEQTDISYTSKHPGCMHACGHDAHMAMLLGGAKILAENKDKLQGRVKIIFQPGEEGGVGAKRVVDEGHLDDVHAIFGVHVWPFIEAGTVATVAGPMMASSDGFRITIKGKGGHAASPHSAKDPMPAAIDLYNGLYKYLTRQVPVEEPVVLTIPMIVSSEAYNLIPHEVVMEGTLRTYSMEIRDEIAGQMERMTVEYARAWGLEGDLSFFRLTHPPLINDQHLVHFVFQGAEDLEIPTQKAEKTMVSEDFPFFLEKVPGVFMFLGVRTTDGFPLHHPKFTIESEDVFGVGAGLLAYLAFKYLREE